MGGPYDALPFPRVQSYGQGVSSTIVTIDATFGKNLSGNIYRIRDENAEGSVKLLRVVRNGTGSALTTTHKCVGFAIAAVGEFGRKAVTIVAAGDPCKPIDDAYSESYSVPSNDLFYVIEKGLTYVNKPTAGGSAITGLGVCYADSDGKATPNTAGLGFVFGRAATTSVDGDTTQLVEVTEGLNY